MNNSLLVTPCVTSHMAFSQALGDAALDVSGCELTHDVKHLTWPVLNRPLASPPILPQAALDLFPFVWWPFGTYLPPALWWGVIFPSLRSLPPSLCMDVTAHSLQQCWIPAP